MKELGYELIKIINVSLNKVIKDNDLNTREIYSMLSEMLHANIETFLRFCRHNSTSENYKDLKIELKKIIIEIIEKK